MVDCPPMSHKCKVLLEVEEDDEVEDGDVDVADKECSYSKV